MTSNFTEKTSNFYNITAHGLNLGSDRFFKLPENVVLIIPSTLQSLYTGLIAEAVMWQLNLIKPDETLLNVKGFIDRYKSNHAASGHNLLDFKVYDSRSDHNIMVPNILYGPDPDNHLFAAIMQCPLKIKLEYLVDNDCVLSQEESILLDQQNMVSNHDKFSLQNTDRISPQANPKCIKKKKGDTVDVDNTDVIAHLEQHIQNRLHKFELTTHEKTNNPITPLLYPHKKSESKTTYIVEGRHELITQNRYLNEIINTYRNDDSNKDKVLYFFSFGCNVLPGEQTKEQEESYYKFDTYGKLLDDYIRDKTRFDEDTIDNQEEQYIRNDISNINRLHDRKALDNYIKEHKLSILRLGQILDYRKLELNELIKADIIDIIVFKKINDIDNILKRIYEIFINKDRILDNNQLNDILKDCTIDKINMIISKINLGKTFDKKEELLILLNNRKRLTIIEQLEEIEVRIINTDESKRKSIPPVVFKDINEALNNCSKDDIDVIKANIKNVKLKNLITQALESKKKEIEEKEKEIEEKEKYTDLTLFRLKMIDTTFNKNQINNQVLYDKLNTKKNINEIDKIVQQEKNPGIIQYGLTNLKKFVDEIPTYEDLLNIRNKIDTDNTIKFKNLILNYIENKETQFLLMLMADGKFRNKYLKYKKKYINLKKIIAINK